MQQGRKKTKSLPSWSFYSDNPRVGQRAGRGLGLETVVDAMERIKQ